MRRTNGEERRRPLSDGCSAATAATVLSAGVGAGVLWPSGCCFFGAAGSGLACAGLGGTSLADFVRLANFSDDAVDRDGFAFLNLDVREDASHR
jgi:hypothetical protein